MATTEAWKKAAEAGNWESNFLSSDETKKLFDMNYIEFKSILTDLGMIKGK
jgi:tripartite-type tricarboxylate transporter receptor subunit TctC